MARPRIGITTTPTLHFSSNLGIDRPVDLLDRAYVDAVTLAGGLALLLPTVSPDLAAALVATLDGLVLSGGGDVDPACYGAERQPETAGVREDRDVFELACVREARAVGLPTLCVCRGAQVLNVSCGGTLVQHLTDPTHKDVVSWHAGSHAVRVQEGTRLAQVLGARELAVNSLHHQAVEQLGDGLRASAFDPAGLVEAIEPVADEPLIGVQWHPEMMADDGASGALFSWLVELAGG
ncbi:MAG: gamma-glutamyl-gamma-aminobutyrate hydrolase family protein [Actinobacteria bacterium]|nr:gamma-glutamyl-gamma-aminobutyrate hydrolase family protein [Actinomycetota bacterium]